jgi:transcriptional regulator with XRE-family HTH domain
MSAGRPNDGWAPTIPIPSVEALGKAISSRRRAFRLSQKRLGEMIGVEPSAISRIESEGNEDLPFGVVTRLVETLELELELRPRGSKFVPRPPTKLSELNLSPKTMFALRKEGLEEINELAPATAFLARPELGDGTALYEIVCALNRYGLSLPGSRTSRVASARDLEIFRLRIVEGLLLQELADRNGLHIERVRQILRLFGVFGAPPAASRRRKDQARARERERGRKQPGPKG